MKQEKKQKVSDLLFSSIKQDQVNKKEAFSTHIHNFVSETFAICDSIRGHKVVCMYVYYEIVIPLTGTIFPYTFWLPVS